MSGSFRKRVAGAAQPTEKTTGYHVAVADHCGEKHLDRLSRIDQLKRLELPGHRFHVRSAPGDVPPGVALVLHTLE
jgi:hypothetical protein